MPKIRSITFSYGRTINLGDYNSFRGDATITLDMTPGDENNLDNICQSAWGMLSENIKFQYTKATEKPGKVRGTGQEFYLGLPIDLDPSDAHYKVFVQTDDESEKEKYNADSGS